MTKRVVKKRPWVSSMIIGVYCICNWIQLLESACVPRNGCDTALAYYTVQRGEYLDGLARRFQTTIADLKVFNAIGSENVVITGNYIYFPFSCECVDGVLSHVFTYEVQYDDTFIRVANNLFEGLSKPDWIIQASGITPDTVIDRGSSLQVPVNCSCGNPDYPDYGLFATYPAFSSDNASDLASKFSISESLLQSFNPSADLNGTLSDGDILFFPVKENGAYRPYNIGNNGSSSNNRALIIGVSVGGGVAVLLFILALCLCWTFLSRKKRPRKGMHDDLEKVQLGSGVSGERASEILKSPLRGTQGSSHASSALSDFTVDKSVEFSFEELAAATNNFNVANKIGEGGYGSVYLANLRGQKLAVKRMNLQATREFMAELQVLTHVHHTNLNCEAEAPIDNNVWQNALTDYFETVLFTQVQLIGYCTVDSLFLIYEYVENGTLDRHLHGSHNLPPLSWQARVQIALDAARGLEYIHEHTKPTYIHRDVKSSNILIDKQLHAKVADFGLTKLTESGAGSVSLTGPTRLVGTFGYMSPEYARFGDVSPKVDVYSFGVVLFEIISAKAAIVRSTGSSTDPAGTHKEEQRGLVTVFEEVLTHPEGKENLGRLMDPALKGNYPLEAAWKMTQLAGACTQENPELRPSMRTAVVALMTLSSTSQDWEMSAFGSDTVITGLISGR